MATEEQTAGSGSIYVYGPTYRIRVGQRLVIANRQVTKLSLKLRKVGSPTGDITLTVRRVSNDSIILSKVWGNITGLGTGYSWPEVTFDTPAVVNEEVRILAEFSGGDADNRMELQTNIGDIKPDEYLTHYRDSIWQALATQESTYIYTYAELAVAAGGGPAALVAAGII